MKSINVSLSDRSIPQGMIGRLLTFLPVHWAGRLRRAGTANPPHFEEGTMFIECQAADPAVHNLCVRIAIRCTEIIKPLLRQEEVREALTEFYRAARLEIEKREPIEEL